MDSSQHHAPAALTPRTVRRCTMNRKLDGPQMVKEKSLFFFTGIPNPGSSILQHSHYSYCWAPGHIVIRGTYKKLTHIKIRTFSPHIAKQFLRFHLMARQIMKNIPVEYELAGSLLYSQKLHILSVSRKTTPAHILPSTSFRSVVPKGNCVKTARPFSVVTRPNTLRLLLQLI